MWNCRFCSMPIAKTEYFHHDTYCAARPLDLQWAVEPNEERDKYQRVPDDEYMKRQIELPNFNPNASRIRSEFRNNNTLSHYSRPSNTPGNVYKRKRKYNADISFETKYPAFKRQKWNLVQSSRNVEGSWKIAQAETWAEQNEMEIDFKEDHYWDNFIPDYAFNRPYGKGAYKKRQRNQEYWRRRSYKPNHYGYRKDFLDPFANYNKPKERAQIASNCEGNAGTSRQFSIKAEKREASELNNNKNNNNNQGYDFTQAAKAFIKKEKPETNVSTPQHPFIKREPTAINIKQEPRDPEYEDVTWF